MIAFSLIALWATSRASSSRPATTRPGLLPTSRLSSTCRAPYYLPPSRLALHNARKRRARRGPGRAGAAAARRAVLLFPRGRRASLFCRADGVGARLCRELFLWSGCARLWGRERLFARCALSRGVVKQLTKCGNAFSLLPRRRMRGLALLLLASVDSALRRTRPFLGVSKRNQTRRTRAGRVQNRAGLGGACILQATSIAWCAAPALTPAVQISVSRPFGAALATRGNGSL